MKNVIYGILIGIIGIIVICAMSLYIWYKVYGIEALYQIENDKYQITVNRHIGLVGTSSSIEISFNLKDKVNSSERKLASFTAYDSVGVEFIGLDTIQMITYRSMYVSTKNFDQEIRPVDTLLLELDKTIVPIQKNFLND